MNIFQVDRQRKPQLPRGSAFDHLLDPSSDSAGPTSRALSLPAAGGALPNQLERGGVGGDTLVFSGASRLTRFVLTTHFSTKGDISR